MIHQFKKICILVIFCIVIHSAKAQHHTYAPAWVFHDDSTTINGIGVGLNATYKVNQVVVNGLNIEALGYGLIVPIIPKSPLSADSLAAAKRLTEQVAMRVNGLNVSPSGSVCDCKMNGVNVNGMAAILIESNGASFSAFANFAEKSNGAQFAIVGNMASYMKGVQLSLLGNGAPLASAGVQISTQNYAAKHKGVQVGIYNNSQNLTGIQIGLWNKNQKRSMPIINWSF